MEAGGGASSHSSEGRADNKKGLARKLTCSVLSGVFAGVILILLMQVFLTRKAVPEWGDETENAMIKLEEENILRLASAKADFITEIFGRVGESVLQAQAFAAQALLQEPETMVVDHHVMAHPGLEQEDTTWEYSVWFINANGVGLEQTPTNNSLESLLNRSSLMDVPFRGIQRQHSLIYLASLNDPSATGDEVTESNMQGYWGFNMDESGYLEFGLRVECDYRTAEYIGKSSPTAYDPRCRRWYQDAVAAGNTGVIFTNPYPDVKTGVPTVTVATPVFHAVDTTLLLGVVAIDLDFSDIENSIKGLTVVDDEGYAYLLAPGGSGEVVVHKDLGTNDDTEEITALELGLDADEFDLIIARMNEDCSGNATYSRNENTWILAWSHETASDSGATDGSGVCDNGGYITVVTVSKDALLEIFASTGSQIGKVVVFASVVMAAALLLIGCFVGSFTHILSKSVTEPVNQLVDVLRTLNRMDFSKQSAGTWIVNDITSSEVEELMMAFEAMATVIKFANVTMGSGDIDIAQQNYFDAKVLFTKLGNDRGVSIVNNNLGNVYTLQARQLAAQAAAETSAPAAAQLVEQANDKFDDAVISYQLAIDDATMLCAGYSQGEERIDGSSPLPGKVYGSGEKEEANEIRRSPSFNPDADVEKAKGAASTGGNDAEDDDLCSSSALSLQLANRKFNLALCLAAKGNVTVPAGVSPDLNAINDARRLMHECAVLAAERKNDKGDQRHVEYLLELSKLERGQPGRQKAAGEALDAAERVIHAYGGTGHNSSVGGIGVGEQIAPPPAERVTLPPPLTILRQQLLAARGTQCVADGHPEEAVKHWTDTVIGCGDRMDVGAVRTSLTGLRDQAKGGLGDQFPEAILVALKLSPLSANYTFEQEKLVAAVEVALTKLDVESMKYAGSLGASGPVVTNVDLCFVMDCTRSMQSWIDQAKDKLFDIIAQAKRDDSNLQLRVSFVGYRDFGDKVRCEGPYDFHTEEEMSKLLSKLAQIKATGGQDVPEDVAGGLNHAVGLSWRSPVRLCILIADAPCHGSQYHSFRDNYPGGCPKGLDPCKLLYTLQYELGVDFYFVRITAATDKMISVLKNTVNDYTRRGKHARRPALRGTNNTEPQFVIHDLVSNNNRFLEVVVDSVKVSAAGINLQVEVY